jgi:tripartite-type tricarboxylate transporter receptor subunit TctC
MLLGPAKTPPEVVTWLQEQVARALNSPDLKEKLKAAGVDVINGNAAEATAFLQAEHKRWAARIKASGTVID